MGREAPLGTTLRRRFVVREPSSLIDIPALPECKFYASRPTRLRVGISVDSSRARTESFREDEGDETAVGASGVRIGFDGSNPVAPRGRGELPTRSNYFAGSDPSKWRVGITSYREVVYEDLYDGIDLVYRSDGAGLKYEFVVRPGADPDRIRWSYQGVVGLEITAGALVVRDRKSVV